MKVGIWGWWQGKNLGDNWIIETLLSIFPNSEAIDTNTKEFDKDMFIICGGGGLFIRDVISPWNIISSELKFGVLGMGAEFPHKSNNAVKLKELSKFFYVRDIYSMQCMKLERATLSYDVTFLNPFTFKENFENDKNIFFIWRDPNELMKYEDFKEYIGELSEKFSWNKTFNNLGYGTLEDTFTNDKKHLNEIINETTLIVSGRYHGIVAAIQAGIPCIGIDIVPKIRAIMEEVGIEEYCIKLSDVNNLKNKIVQLEKNKDNIRKKMLIYRQNAIEELNLQIQDIKNIIYNNTEDIQ